MKCEQVIIWNEVGLACLKEMSKLQTQRKTMRNFTEVNMAGYVTNISI
jgi:hypothetical protein